MKCALAKVCIIENPAVKLMFCMFMLIIGNVARTEDGVVAVEFDEMRLMVSCAEGEGEFSS